MTAARKSRRTASPEPSAKPAAPVRHKVAKPDGIDFRDRLYRPAVSTVPGLTLYPPQGMPVKSQGDTMACTGFGLSLVVEHLLRASGREPLPAISPYMLYSMARRYDEFPGSTADTGSSLRGALKGWFKHGACKLSLFPDLAMPPPANRIEADWWFDAVKRPLGAYYRVDGKNIADMHAALGEVGVLFASAGCHSGWDEGINQPTLKRRPASIDKVWTIPVQGGHAQHPGHAFAIVGYNEIGFLVQNSWGVEWGSHGYAVLTYDDWLRNAMDCWVAQLGVVTQDHREIARAGTLRRDATGRIALAASEVLRNREISPFVINMGSNGALSNSGQFRTTPDDVRAIVDVQLERAREEWGLADGPVDVCLYAHSGMSGEAGAADVAAQWVPLLYQQRVFPIFLMWETDFWSNCSSLISGCEVATPRGDGGRIDADGWWNQRIEKVLARPGTALWNEMKDNAQRISAYRKTTANGKPVPDDDQAGAVLLYRYFKQQVAQQRVRMHLVAHSAGAVVGTYLIDRLLADSLLRFESVSFLAPAVRIDVFDKSVRPHLASGAVRRYQQFMLSEQAEENDPSCGLYRRSLLKLIAESFEGGTRVPLLGLQQDYAPYARKLVHAEAHVSPGADSASTTHLGFESDAATRAQVLKFIHHAPSRRG